MRFGTGIDIVDIEKLRGLIERSGPRFLTRWFSSEEISYCEAKARPSQHYAARFAAKEAAIKALGLGWRDGVSLKDVSVTVGSSGAPQVRLGGVAAERAARRGIEELHVSLSHCARYAVASVIVVFRQS